MDALLLRKLNFIFSNTIMHKYEDISLNYPNDNFLYMVCI